MSHTPTDMTNGWQWKVVTPPVKESEGALQTLDNEGWIIHETQVIWDSNNVLMIIVARKKK